MKRIITILLSITIGKGFAQNISIDNSFGNSGFSITPNTTELFSFDFSNNGDIISAGYTIIATGTNDLTLTKTNSNGILDTNFGTSGIVKTHIENSQIPYDVKVQENNKILVCGNFSGNGSYAYAIRYNNDGTLDQNFATGGVFKFNSLGSSFSSIITLPDGSSILGGNDLQGGILVKLNNNGTLNDQFGNNGVLKLYNTDFKFSLNRAITLKDNKILAVGNVSNDDGTITKIAYCKTDNQGNFDLNFAIGGKFTTDLYEDFDLSTETILDVKEFSNNKILLNGNFGGAYFFVRLNSDGTFDNTFGSNGIVEHDYIGNIIEIQENDKILLAGNQSLAQYSITRFFYDGNVDNNGLLDINLSQGNDYVQHLKIQNNNKLILGGSANAQFTLARINLFDNLSVTDLTRNKDIIIFPNPTNKTLNINAKFAAEQINVYDSTGKKVLQIQNPKAQKIDTTHLPNGVYHLEIISNKDKYTKKFIIKKE